MTTTLLRVALVLGAGGTTAIGLTFTKREQTWNWKPLAARFHCHALVRDCTAVVLAIALVAHGEFQSWLGHPKIWRGYRVERRVRCRSDIIACQTKNAASN
jgi:hypothetical protein